MKMEPVKFDIDMDKLSIGDFLPVETVERILEMPHTNSKYGLRFMVLAVQVMNHFSKRGRDDVLVIQDGLGLRICTPNEAAKVHDQRIRNEDAQRKRRYHKMAATNPQEIDAKNRDLFERNLIYTSRMVDASRQERKKIFPLSKPVERNTPLLG